MAEPENQSDGMHGVTPVIGSCRQLNGDPADLMNPQHYPVEALCAECGLPVRTPRYWSAMWDHIERFTLAGPVASPG